MQYSSLINQVCLTCAERWSQNISESNMAAQCNSSRETFVIYCLLALMFVCVSINSVVHTVLSKFYLWTWYYDVICAKYCFLCFYSTGITNNRHVHLGFLTSWHLAVTSLPALTSDFEINGMQRFIPQHQLNQYCADLGLILDALALLFCGERKWRYVSHRFYSLWMQQAICWSHWTWKQRTTF